MLRRGGEQGIRTLEASFKAYTISSRAPSTSSDNSPYQTARILYQKGDQNASPFFLKKFQKTLDFIYCLLYNLNVAFIGVWRSLVSRLVRDQEASGSSPDTPTTPGVHMDTRFYCHYEHPYQNNNPRIPGSRVFVGYIFSWALCRRFFVRGSS